MTQKIILVLTHIFLEERQPFFSFYKGFFFMSENLVLRAGKKILARK